MEKKWDTVTPADLKKTLCKWDLYVSLVTKGLIGTHFEEVKRPEREDNYSTRSNFGVKDAWS